jgi:hypothetical protein
MKKLFIITLALGLLVSCKKSENDPGITFRSRDKKIVGEWNLESFENYNLNQTGAAKTEITEKYAGSTITTTNVTGANTNTNVGTTSFKGTLKINKNGTAEYTEVSTVGSVSATRTYSGNWAWGNSKRNKTILQLDFDGFNSPILQRTYLYIDELRNDKFVCVENRNSVVSSGTTTTTKTNNLKITFVQ